MAAYILNWLRRVVMGLALVTLSACSGAFFYPMKPLVRTPADLGMPYQDIYLQTADGIRLHAWLLTREQPLGRILFLHGNAENISTHIGSVYWLPEAGYEVLLLDYRGYGQSAGTPLLPEVLMDIDSAWQWLIHYHEQQPATRCAAPVVLAQSLGASLAASYLGQQKTQVQPSAVVLDAGFASYPGIAADVLRRSFLTWAISPLAWLVLPGQLDAERWIGQIQAPLLQFHSQDDIVIPYRHGQRLHAAASQPKTWVATTGSHILTFNQPKNRQVLLEFLDQQLIDLSHSGGWGGGSTTPGRALSCDRSSRLHSER
jgi:fermentation-respiration switch protein FrsA (DUF1100 family)